MWDLLNSAWTVASALVFAFALGARLMYALTVETKLLKKKLDANNAVDVRQQLQLDAVMKQVQDLLAVKGVKKITIRKKKNEAPAGN